MEKFLEKYIKMFEDMKNIKLNKHQRRVVVNNLMQCDEIWDALAYHVNEELNGIESEVI